MLFVPAYCRVIGRLAGEIRIDSIEGFLIRRVNEQSADLVQIVVASSAINWPLAA